MERLRDDDQGDGDGDGKVLPLIVVKKTSKKFSNYASKTPSINGLLEEWPA